jgi:phi13 family phage major tail protein
MDKINIVDYRGIEGLFAAELLTDDADDITYGEPRQLCAVSTLSKTTSTSSATKYYNNIPAIITRSVGGDEVSIDASAISEQDQAWLMGEYYDEETGLYVEGEPELKYFAIGYATKKTDGSEMLVWRLKGTFGYPEAEHATEDDGTDSAGNSITYSGVNTLHVFAKTGKTAKAVNIPAAKYAAGKDKFFESVKTPDTIAAV